MAIETLRPSEHGDEENLSRVPDTGEHNWQNVDEAVADEATTNVYTLKTTYIRDLYDIPAHSLGSGTIDSVTMYFRIASNYATATAYAKPAIKTNGTVYDGTEQSRLGTSWITKSQTYLTNPNTGLAWTWAEIDALQIGVSLKVSPLPHRSRCTQVYIDVAYTIAVVVGFSKGFILG